jgi:hypothetical protein
MAMYIEKMSLAAILEYLCSIKLSYYRPDIGTESNKGC